MTDFRLSAELRESILEDGYGAEVPAALERLVQATRITAVRLKQQPVGEPQRARTLGQLFTGKQAPTTKVPLADCERFRLLLTMSFDHGFTPVGDNDIRLMIRDDDLAAHRLDRAAPMIHSVG